MIAPIGAPTFREALRWGAETYHSLKSVLEEGRHSPPRSVTRAASRRLRASSKAALDLISEAITKAGLHLRLDVVLAMDVAATEFHSTALTPTRAARRAPTR